MSDDVPTESTRAAVADAVGTFGAELLSQMEALVPLRSPMREYPAADAAEVATRAAARHKRARAALADVVAEWKRVRARAALPTVSAVLAIHCPQEAYERPVCAECRESGWDGADPVYWPCNTYTAIKENTP